MFCITAQTQSSLWGWRHAWMPPFSPPRKVFKAPECYTDSQMLPRTQGELCLSQQYLPHNSLQWCLRKAHWGRPQLQPTVQESWFPISSSATSFLHDLEHISLILLQLRSESCRRFPCFHRVCLVWAWGCRTWRSLRFFKTITTVSYREWEKRG